MQFLVFFWVAAEDRFYCKCIVISVKINLIFPSISFTDRVECIFSLFALLFNVLLFLSICWETVHV